jgi:acetoin utilization protein AcuB
MDHIPPIKAVMTPFPHTIDADAPLRQARNMMLEHEIRHLPVKRRQRLVGVLTDRDLKRALDPSLGLAPKDELFVDDVMIADAYTVSLDEPLDAVLVEMADRHIGCVLVVKDHHLAGIFTNTDACRVLAEELRERFGAGDGGDAA